MTQRIANILTAIVAGLVFLIGAGAFTLSYDSLRQAGLAGGIPPALSWLWPLLIDAPLIVFTLALLVAQLTRQSIKLWAFFVILYTLATVGFNLSHAQPSPLGWFVAIVAPVGLLLTTEALRSLAKHSIERGAVVQSLAELTAKLAGIERQKEKSQAELSALQAAIKAGKIGQKAASIQQMNAARAAKIEARRGQVLDMLRQELSQEEIAGKLGVSVRTIRNDMRQLNGKV